MNTTERQIKEVETIWETFLKTRRCEEFREVTGRLQRGENKNGKDDIFKEIMVIREFP